MNGIRRRKYGCVAADEHRHERGWRGGNRLYGDVRRVAESVGGETGGGSVSWGHRRG